MPAGLYVVDCSVSIGWLFGEQSDEYTGAALQALTQSYAVAPRWWTIEVLNVLLALERRGRLASGRAVEALQQLLRLPIQLHDSTSSVFELHDMASRYQLTSYDTLYLEVALATGLPLATRNKALQRAALGSGVGVWQPGQA